MFRDSAQPVNEYPARARVRSVRLPGAVTTEITSRKCRYATVLSLPAFVCIAGVVVSGRHVMRHGGSSGKTRNHGFERHGIETRPHRRGRGKLESDKDMLSDPQPGARGW